MYEQKIAKAYGRGGLLTCGVMVVGAILGLALVTTVLLLIRGGDVEPRSPRLALALSMPLVFIVGVLMVAAVIILLRGRRLDRAFDPWGFRGKQSGPGIRSWHGEIGGRRLDAWFHKGPTLELYLDCAPATRGVLYRGGQWIRAATRFVESREPMNPTPIALGDGAVFADDSAWMRELLERPEAESAVRTLMDDTPRTISIVSLVPDAVKYTRRFLPLAEIHADNVRHWLAELEKLAAAIDAQGPSAEGAQPTRLENWARRERGKFMNRIFLGLGAVMVLVQLTLFLFGWLYIGTP